MSDSSSDNAAGATPVAAEIIQKDPFDVTWRERLVVLGSVAAAVIVAFSLGLVYANDATVELMGLIPVSVVAAGKFLPLWGIGDSHFNPWELGLVIWAMDTVTVLLIVYGLEGIYGIKPAKRALLKIQANAKLVLTAYPRIKRTTVAGVVLFVLFPVAGTGALGGGFLGILLGLHRVVLISAVSIGGLLGGMLMAFAAVNFGDAMQALMDMQSDPAVKWVSIGVVILVLVVGFMLLNRAYKRALELAREQSEAAPADAVAE